METMKISRHVVGFGQPVYIVAEMSANHGQSFDQAVYSWSSSGLPTDVEAPGVATDRGLFLLRISHAFIPSMDLW